MSIGGVDWVGSLPGCLLLANQHTASQPGSGRWQGNPQHSRHGPWLCGYPSSRGLTGDNGYCDAHGYITVKLQHDLVITELSNNTLGQADF